MAYVKQGERDVWKYESEIPSSGDPIRVALYGLFRNVEAYLFDYDAPGYNRPEFLSWALEFAKATHNASGMAVNDERRWNPSKHSEDREPLDPAETGRSGNYFSGIITYRDPELDASKARASEAADDQGDDQDLAPYEMTDPSFARFTNADAVIVNPTGHVDGDPDAEDEGPVGVETSYEHDGPDAPAEYDLPAESHDEDKTEVIETPAESYEPVAEPEDGER